MGLKLSQPIATARSIINDVDSTSYRYSNADLLQYANDALDVIASVKPFLFYQDGDLDCIDNKAMQAISFNDATALIDVRRVKGGNAVTECDRATLDAFNPGWQSMAAADAVNWMRVVDDPLRFMVYPPAPATQILEVIYARIPAEYLDSDDTGIPATYSDMIADYIVSRAQSRDAEHVLSARAQAFGQSFISKLSTK